MDSIYTAEKVAEILNAHIRTIRKKLKAGSLKGYKKMGKWYVLHSDLIAFIKS